MKRLLLSISLIVVNYATSQVGIGINSPDPSADLHLGSADKGLILNNVSISDPNATTFFAGGSAIKAGTVVYNTGGSGQEPAGFYVHNGLAWNRMINLNDFNGLLATAFSTGITSNSYPNLWKTVGNTGNLGTHFFGTTDNQPIVFKTNDQKRMILDENGDLFYDVDNNGTGGNRSFMKLDQNEQAFSINDISGGSSDIRNNLSGISLNNTTTNGTNRLVLNIDELKASRTNGTVERSLKITDQIVIGNIEDPTGNALEKETLKLVENQISLTKKNNDTEANLLFKDNEVSLRMMEPLNNSYDNELAYNPRNLILRRSDSGTSDSFLNFDSNGFNLQSSEVKNEINNQVNTFPEELKITRNKRNGRTDGQETSILLKNGNNNQTTDFVLNTPQRESISFKFRQNSDDGSGGIKYNDYEYVFPTNIAKAPGLALGVQRIDSYNITNGTLDKAILDWITIPDASRMWAVRDGNFNIDPNRDFLGTADLQPLIIKTNNVERARFSETGKLTLGTVTNPSSLEIIAGSSNNSGLKFGNLNSTSGTTPGAAYLGVDNSGNVVLAPTPSGSSSGWSLTGNTGNTSSHFLGTKDANPINFKTNDVTRFSITKDGFSNFKGGFKQVLDTINIPLTGNYQSIFTNKSSSTANSISTLTNFQKFWGHQFFTNNVKSQYGFVGANNDGTYLYPGYEVFVGNKNGGYAGHYVTGGNGSNNIVQSLAQKSTGENSSLSLTDVNLNLVNSDPANNSEAKFYADYSNLIINKNEPSGTNYAQINISKNGAGENQIKIESEVGSYTLPRNAGLNKQVLMSDGAGNATWQNEGGVKTLINAYLEFNSIYDTHDLAGVPATSNQYEFYLGQNNNTNTNTNNKLFTSLVTDTNNSNPIYEGFDTKTEYDNDTGITTVIQSGIYKVEGQISFKDGNGATPPYYRHIIIQIEIFRGSLSNLIRKVQTTKYMENGTTYIHTIPFSGLFKLEASDQIRVKVMINKSTDQTVSMRSEEGGGHTFLSVQQLSAESSSK